MARQGFDPEIKAAMGRGEPPRVNRSPPKESPADIQRDAKRGIKEGSAQDTKLDAMPANQAPQRPQMPSQAPMGGGTPSDLHHVAAATSIAHAILGKSGGQY